MKTPEIILIICSSIFTILAFMKYLYFRIEEKEGRFGSFLVFLVWETMGIMASLVVYVIIKFFPISLIVIGCFTALVLLIEGLVHIGKKLKK